MDQLLRLRLRMGVERAKLVELGLGHWRPWLLVGVGSLSVRAEHRSERTRSAFHSELIKDDPSSDSVAQCELHERRPCLIQSCYAACGNEGTRRVALCDL